MGVTDGTDDDDDADDDDDDDDDDDRAVDSDGGEGKVDDACITTDSSTGASATHSRSPSALK